MPPRSRTESEHTLVYQSMASHLWRSIVKVLMRVLNEPLATDSYVLGASQLAKRSPEFDSWSSVPALVAGASAIAIALAVAYQAGRYIELDLTLLSLMSVQDILANSFSFLPVAGATIILATVLERMNMS